MILLGDPADNLKLREILLDARRGFVLHVVQMHDFVLDVEVELPPEEGTEVLMDEVVKGVARGVALEVRLQSAVVGRLAARHDVGRAQLAEPFCQCSVGRGQDAFGGDRDQVFLDRGLLLAEAFLFGPVGERRRAVLEQNDEFLALLTVLLGYEVVTGVSRRHQDEHAVITLGSLDVAVLALGGVRQPEVHAHGPFFRLPIPGGKRSRAGTRSS